ncbi:MAG: serine hydrolase [Bacteroidales bacterium]|nr:serine hydrolase [Bacteroidales bacterium]
MRKIIFLLFFLPLFVYSQGIERRIETELSISVLQNDNNLIPFLSLDTLQISYKGIGNDNGVFLSSMRRYTNVSEDFSSGNLLIIGVFEDNQEEYNKLIEKSGNVVICFFQNNSFDNLNLDNENIIAVVDVGYSDSLAYDYCGQFLFGGFTSEGEGIRFKYTIPAEVGLDSAFIFHKVDSIANFAVSSGATPGCQVFVAVNQKVIFNKSYGYHTPDSLISVKNTDLYDLASVTKVTASAAALMKLSDENLIDVNQPFSTYWRPFKHSDKKEISMLDVLCHQGQLTAWIPFWKSALDEKGNLSSKYFSTVQTKKYSLQVTDNLFINRRYPKRIYREIKKSTLIGKKEYKYSDLSFYLYPKIVENLTKIDFESFLKQNFYSKLGANSLCYNPLKYYSKDEIVPTEIDNFFRKQLLQGYVHDEGSAMLGGISGHAGLFGNANDVAKVAQMYLNFGEYGAYKYLDSVTVRKWTSYQFKELGNRRGIVFDKPLLEHKEWGTPSPDASESSFGHTGFTGIFVWADPENGLLIVFLSNRVYPTRDNKLLMKYNIRTNIHQVFYDAFEKRNKN